VAASNGKEAAKLETRGQTSSFQKKRELPKGIRQPSQYTYTLIGRFWGFGGWDEAAKLQTRNAIICFNLVATESKRLGKILD
jgi:hypothetical protein